MELSFKDKVVLVTGGGTGIGLATAKAFAENGASVVLNGRREDIIQAAANEIIADGGGTAVAIQGDVSDEQQVAKLFEKIVERFGRLDIAFNNAGGGQKGGNLADISIDEFDRIINTHLRGVFLCMKHEIPIMMKNGGGAIVNTSSGAGIIGIPGAASYVAAKHGIIGLSKSAALDYAASNIRVNVIAPGYVETPMYDPSMEWDKVLEQIPVRRIGKPEEIAAAVLYLCSDVAAYTTGSVMVVDGAQTV
ncbi:glucose 1-dehydrogenase [Bacillus sp. FJAT-49711]|uniref:SDR family NAD(P)-dependent oxidoreductase n=1 Tax=Bacillus sp. FJAT-49711 TaxID=2833585 RepID=UPI001BC9E215|nr:glucose 1-dehydrogenase [Bacillus sp. FJAT-49711]MBS4220750.1 glucose 1-dehydrogenase [Bacillus sp. FJAT-49711]